MGDFKFFKIKIEEQVAVISFENPPVNVLTSPVMTELDSLFQQLEQDPSVKVIVFTSGNPNAFIAGADIKEIAQIDTAVKGKDLALKGQAVFNRIENSEKIAIAAINGICVGGGCELILSFHLRVASERAKFGQPEINLGIIPGFGGTQRLTRLVGIAKAREIILTGDMVTAAEAYRIGLVNRMVPDGELIKQALGLAKKIASKGKAAIELCEQAMREGGQKSLPEGLALEASLFGKVAETEDKKEGVTAFLEKRQPKFQDR